MIGLRTVAFIGDSITHAWPLAWYLQNFINAGVSGNNSAEMYARISADVSQLSPWACVILAGTNDVEQYATPSISDVESMANSLRGNHIKCVLCTIPPVQTTANRPNTTDAKVRAWNAQIVSFARDNRFPFADLYNAMLLPDGTPDWSLFIPEVGITGVSAHPFSDGYERMWTELERVIA